MLRDATSTPQLCKRQRLAHHPTRVLATTHVCDSRDACVLTGCVAQVLLVPVRQLQSALNHLEESKGYLIDARLRCLAIGLALCPRMFR